MDYVEVAERPPEQPPPTPLDRHAAVARMRQHLVGVVVEPGAPELHDAAVETQLALRPGEPLRMVAVFVGV